MKRNDIWNMLSKMLALPLFVGCADTLLSRGMWLQSPVTETSPDAAMADVAAVDAATPNKVANAKAVTFDNSACHYDAENDVYWQIGVPYCANPEVTDYETLGILCLAPLLFSVIPLTTTRSG